MKNTVIFDLDGTLLDTLQDLTDGVNAALMKNGYPKRTIDEVRTFVGNGIRKLVSRALPEGEENPDFERVFADFRSYYMKHCNDATKPYAGIEDLLQNLNERGFRLAIVSNKADAAVKELNQIYFAGVISTAIGEKESEGIRKKPAPDTVFEALRLLESTVDESVYVGDSEVDIETARNAGMDAVLCAWGFRSEKFLKDCGAKKIIHLPAELLVLFNKETL